MLADVARQRTRPVNPVQTPGCLLGILRYFASSVENREPAESVTCSFSRAPANREPAEPRDTVMRPEQGLVVRVLNYRSKWPLALPG